MGRENGLKGPVQNTGTGEMALAVPADNLGLVLSTTMICGHKALFWSLQAPGTQVVLRYTCRKNTHTHKLKINNLMG